MEVMIRYIFLLSLLIGPACVYGQPGNDVLVFAYFKGNGEDGLHLAYSKDGYQWSALHGDKSVLAPAVGSDKLMRDPCIIKGPDGTFHMVWTVSWNERVIGYAHSRDLVHWSEQRAIPVMADESAARNCWAPEIFYDAASKTFMIYWATTITGRFKETQSTKENGYNHRLYYVTTTDFMNFTPARLLYDAGFNVIDATLHRSGDKYLMFLKDETPEPVQKNIRIASSSKLTEGYGKPGPPITGGYWAEGPTVLKASDRWIVYFDKYTEHAMGAVESTDLEHWTDISERVVFPVGVRHGTVLQLSAAEFNFLQSQTER